MKVNENDQPWVDSKLLEIDRKRKREYSKKKRSKKWEGLNKAFLSRAKNLKETYYENVVEDLKFSNISQWYSKVKRMSSIDATKEEFTQVKDLEQMPSSEQAEYIADKFAQISNQYAPLVKENIHIPNYDDSQPAPLFEPFQIHEKIKRNDEMTEDLNI